MSKFNLLSVNADAKTIKSNAYGVLTGILYLAPGINSGRNVCPMATAGCLSACLYSAGRGRFSNVQLARIRKTKMYFNDKDTFMHTLAGDIGKLARLASDNNMQPAVRLNGTSDIDFTNTGIFDMFSDIQFYDYTKVHRRLYTNKYSNYQLTLSRSESNEDQLLLALMNGFNVAVVFDELPQTYLGYEVIDGDQYDARFLDPEGGYVVGLKAKGEAKKDTSGFVVLTKNRNTNVQKRKNIHDYQTA
jgi:hypothetical protein